MKKFKVPYVRIEHQVTFFEIEAEDEIQAEEIAREIQSMRFFVIRLLLLDDGYAYYLSSDGISGATPPMLGLGDR